MNQTLNRLKMMKTMVMMKMKMQPVFVFFYVCAVFQGLACSAVAWQKGSNKEMKKLSVFVETRATVRAVYRRGHIGYQKGEISKMGKQTGLK